MTHDRPVTIGETRALFADLARAPCLLLAVSGGPDSTALMVLAARWRDTLEAPPNFVAVTVDHGLRKEAKGEAAAVAKLARILKIAHRTLRWTGAKPKTGLQEAARMARYRLLGDAARKAGASHILTAHTLDDQAETVLIRMSRGSGITGLGAMERHSVVPGRAGGGGPAATLVRPFLDIPKARLVATLDALKIRYAKDPSNLDPRFTRVRMRTVMPALAAEGLDARRLAALAVRLRRADTAIARDVDRAWTRLAETGDAAVIVFDAAAIHALEAEVRLRLLGRAIDRLGDEGPVQLGKLEALESAVDTACGTGRMVRRSLAGALVTAGNGRVMIERAPPRRAKTLTTTSRKSAKRSRTR